MRPFSAFSSEVVAGSLEGNAPKARLGEIHRFQEAVKGSGLAAVPPAQIQLTTGRLGPNAIIRVAEALEPYGFAMRELVFRQAGLTRYLASPPRHMVDEGEVAQLHQALRRALGPEGAALIAAEAGRLTGNYLLARRIPLLAQRALRLLPRRAAAGLLAHAISKHAWTFIDSGQFDFRFDPQLVLEITGSPLCRQGATAGPVCHYYAATFERLFAAVLGDATRVRETQCAGAGAVSCRFLLTTDSRHAAGSRHV